MVIPIPTRKQHLNNEMVKGVWRELQSKSAKGGKIREGKGKKGKPAAAAAAKLIIDLIHHQSRPTSFFPFPFPFQLFTLLPPSILPSIIIFILFYLHHRNLLHLASVIDNSLTSRASPRYFSRSQRPNTNPTTTDLLRQDHPVSDVLIKIRSFINTISVAG